MRRIIGVIGILLLTFSYFTLVASDGVFVPKASRPSQVLLESNTDTVNLQDTLSSQTDVQETRVETENEVVAFETKQVPSSYYPNGTRHIVTDGKSGIKKTTYNVEYRAGAVVSRVATKSEIIVMPITEVISIGTGSSHASNSQMTEGNCDPNYDPCVPFSSTDLNCDDIQVRVRIIQTDPHRFDADKDGYGCEDEL